MVDEILEEVWRNRDDFAKRHNYDLDDMVAELREMERHSWSIVISREKRDAEQAAALGCPSLRR